MLLLLHLLLLLFAVSLTNGQNCTGICGGGGGAIEQQQQQQVLVLLNAAQEVIVDGQQGTCGFFDALCLDDDSISLQAQDAGCICGAPFKCSGVCAQGEELLNATLEVNVNGLLATCEFHDSIVKQGQITEESCLAEAFAVRQAGCNCVGNGNYTCPGVCDGNGEELLSFDQEANVDGVQIFCGFHDSQVKEEISETGCKDHRQKVLDAGCICGTRYDCPGVCAAGGTFLNDTLNANVNGMLATCAFHDSMIKEEIIEEQCLAKAAQVRQAGCMCVGNYSCPGLCDGDDDELLNFDEDVTVDGQLVFCGFHDNQVKEENSESGCLDYRQKVLDAGCVCGARYDCPGVCGQGGRLLNATLNVNVSGLIATCGLHDTKLKEEIIEERCLFQASTAQEAGCVCVENDFNCTGICHDKIGGGGELLNVAQDVNVNDELATCGFHDNNAKQEKSESACLELAQKAQDAGCICGGRYDCPGVCAAGEVLLNADLDVTVDDQLSSCGFLDAKAKEENFEEQRCLDTASKAQSAGCICAVALNASAAPAFLYSYTLLLLASMLAILA